MSQTVYLQQQGNNFSIPVNYNKNNFTKQVHYVSDDIFKAELHFTQRNEK